jgi:hypothetical protein
MSPDGPHRWRGLPRSARFGSCVAAIVALALLAAAASPAATAAQDDGAATPAVATCPVRGEGERLETTFRADWDDGGWPRFTSTTTVQTPVNRSGIGRLRTLESESFEFRSLLDDVLRGTNVLGPEQALRTVPFSAEEIAVCVAGESFVATLTDEATAYTDETLEVGPWTVSLDAARLEVALIGDGPPRPEHWTVRVDLSGYRVIAAAPVPTGGDAAALEWVFDDAVPAWEETVRVSAEPGFGHRLQLALAEVAPGFDLFGLRLFLRSLVVVLVDLVLILYLVGIVPSPMPVHSAVGVTGAIAASVDALRQRSRRIAFIVPLIYLLSVVISLRWTVSPFLPNGLLGEAAGVPLLVWFDWLDAALMGLIVLAFVRLTGGGRSVGVAALAAALAVLFLVVTVFAPIPYGFVSETLPRLGFALDGPAYTVAWIAGALALSLALGLAILNGIVRVVRDNLAIVQAPRWTAVSGRATQLALLGFAVLLVIQWLYRVFVDRLEFSTRDPFAVPFDPFTTIFNALGNAPRYLAIIVLQVYPFVVLAGLVAIVGILGVACPTLQFVPALAWVPKLLLAMFAFFVVARVGAGAGLALAVAFAVTVGLGLVIASARARSLAGGSAAVNAANVKQVRRVGLWRARGVEHLRRRRRAIEDQFAKGESTMTTYSAARREVARDAADLDRELALRTTELPQAVRERLQRDEPEEFVLALGPLGTWWDNGKEAARLGLILATVPLGYFLYVLLTSEVVQAFVNAANGPTFASLLTGLVSEVAFWLVAALVLGCFYPYLPGRNGVLKGAVLTGIGAAGVLAGTLFQTWTGGGWSFAWSFRLLELLLFLSGLGFLLDFTTVREQGVDWRGLLRLYQLDDVRVLAGYASSAVVVVFSFAQLLLQGLGQDAVLELVRQFPNVIPPAPGG